MSILIKGMKMPQHAAVNGDKDTAYRCIILAHPDNSVELVIDTEFASKFDNGHNIKRYPLFEIPTPHGRLIDADVLFKQCIPDDVFTEDICFTSDIKNAPTVIEAEVIK